jgi:RecB family exonuclease
MPVPTPHVVPGDEIRISASTYLAWKRCPESANARLQGIYGPDTRPAFVGTLAHRIFSRHLTAGPIVSEEFAQACREEIGGSNLNHKLGDLSLKPSALAAVIQEVRSLYERFVNFPGEGFESSEVTMEQEIPDGVSLVGTIDAVYREDLGGHRLIDWKTGELGDAEDQLLFYAMLWAMGHEDLPARVEAVSVKTGERFEMVPSSADVGRVRDDVGRMVDDIRSAWRDGGDLDRHGGPWCRYCPILADCPEGRATTALLD